MSSLRREWGARPTAVGRVSAHLVSRAWRVALGGLPSAHHNSPGLRAYVPGLATGAGSPGPREQGHLASVAGEFQVPGVGSKPLPPSLREGWTVQHLLPSSGGGRSGHQEYFKSLSLQLGGEKETRTQRDQQEGQPWLKCLPRPIHNYPQTPTRFIDLRIWESGTGSAKERKSRVKGGSSICHSPTPTPLVIPHSGCEDSQEGGECGARYTAGHSAVREEKHSPREGRRHPQGPVETSVGLQTAGAAQTQKAAAGPCRTGAAWAWPPASHGKVERSQNQGFQFLECCC